MLKSKKGMFIVLSGPSGVGKGSICKSILDKFNSWYSVSMTTRSPREGEVDGKDYYFVSVSEFEKKIEEDDFLEYAKYNNNYYGTLKSVINEKLDNNIDVITEIEINGARNIKKIYPDSVLIYILPPSLEELKDRLIKRNTESIEVINERMNITMEEIKNIDIYDYVVCNDDLDKACEKVINIIRSEKCKTSRNIIEL